MKQIYQYPKTYHLEGSGLNTAKKARDRIPFKTIASRYLVVDEKMDGTNVAISFQDTGEMLLQSRGHFLTEGVREKHFSLFRIKCLCKINYGRDRQKVSKLFLRTWLNLDKLSKLLFQSIHIS